MAEGRPLVGELPQVLVQLAECLGGYLRPVVGSPSPDDRVEPSDYRRCVGPAQGPELRAEPFPDPSDGRLARLDQRLAVVAADVEPEKVEALIEGDDTRLILVESQASRRQPRGEPCFGLECLLPGVAERNEIIGVPDQHRAALHHSPGLAAGRVVADSGGHLHPVQRDVQQHGADPSLAASSANAY